MPKKRGEGHYSAYAEQDKEEFFKLTDRNLQ